MNVSAEEEEGPADAEEGPADAEEKMTKRARETTYGSDFWKQQYKTAEIERETLQSQVRSLQLALKESLDHQSRLLSENEAELATSAEVVDTLIGARSKLAETLQLMGFSVTEKTHEPSLKLQCEAYLSLVTYFMSVRSNQLDSDGLPVKWIGALTILEKDILKSLSFKYGQLDVKEIPLTNALKDIIKLVNHYLKYLNNENKKKLMDSLADAALSEYDAEDAPRPLFPDNQDVFSAAARPRSPQADEEGGPDQRDESPNPNDTEFFRVTNIRIELEEERRLTKDLQQRLSNCERDLENALIKLQAEKSRMDELNLRDEANESKFAALQKTLELLVNGEAKKSLESEKTREMALEIAGSKRQLEGLNKQVDLANKRASDAERRLEVLLKTESQLKSELAGLEMNFSLKLEKKKNKIGTLLERVTDLENVSTELYSQLQDALMVSARLEKDNTALRMQIESLRGGEMSGAWMREKLETQIGRSKALEDALFEMRKQLSAEQNELILQGEAYLALEKQLVEQKEENMGMKRDLDRQKNRADMLERDNANLDAFLIVTKEKVAYLNRRIIDIQGNIRVLCRVRPILPAEKRRYEITEKQIQEIAKYPDYNTMEFNSNPFEFDRVFPPSSTQRHVFDEVESVIRSAMNGVKASIFAYGQTSAGKTYTMQGTGSGEDGNPDRGLVFRSFEVLFDVAQTDIEVKTEFEVSMMEVYNERIRDLLNRTAHEDQTLEVKLAKYGVVVENLGLWPVANLAEAVNIFEIGTAARRVSATDDNSFSSRSHLITVIRINRHNMRTGEKFSGVLHFIDLAGSEKVKMTAASGMRMREAQHINKSLAALSDVITALSNGQRQVPYRNSKLTFLLQDVLKENSKVVMIVCINPIPDNLYESICTLTFGLKCRNVVLGHARRTNVTYDQYSTPVNTIQAPDENDEETGDLSRTRMPHLARR